MQKIKYSKEMEFLSCYTFYLPINVQPLHFLFYPLQNETHISHLIDLGFSAVAIADRVGHESIDITYWYSHLFPSKQVAMVDTLDAVNASFEDCEEVDDDINLEAAEPEHDKAEPMIDLDTVMGAKDSSAENMGDTAETDEADKTVKAVEKSVDSAKAADITENAEAGKAKVVSIEQYRAG